MVDISVCIPVYGTERYLERCLKSVAAQSFLNYEIILVNDGSPGVDEKGLNCKKIVKECKKKLKLPITYIEHSKNLGVLEARRRAVEEASGLYILNLDSDDYLPSNGLELLFNKAKETGADIIHGDASIFYSDAESDSIIETSQALDKRQNKIQKKVSTIYTGMLENRAIFDGYLVHNNQCGFLWAKLIKRDVFLQALNHVPPMFCIMADDFILYFWITYFAKKYVGIKNVVYNYSINTGITSHKIINDLERWKQVCSTSSVFSALYSELNNFDICITNEEADKITSLCYKYVGNNLIQWNKVVAPEIKEDAYNLLCEFWGKDLVQQVEQEVKKQGLL